MSDTVRDLGQRYIAALWDAAGSLGSDPTATERLAGLVAVVGEAEAQLAGLRLHLLHEARLSAADAVVEGVRQSVRTTSAQATAALRLSQDLADRFPLIAAALNDGAISLPQAEGIVAGLKKLPARLSRDQIAECQETILGYVDTLGPSELRTLATRLVEVVARISPTPTTRSGWRRRNGRRIGAGSCGCRRISTGRCGSPANSRPRMPRCCRRSWRR